jgi:hypothetical protein
MDVRFATPDWKTLDVLRSEAILAPFFSDERPLTGVLGLLDWRLCGFVSRMILQGFVHGHSGEAVLVPLRPRMRMDKLFLFGLGPEQDFNETLLGSATERMLEIGTRARVRAMALVLPGRSTGRVSAVSAMESFVRATAERRDQDEVILLEPPEAQREMDAILQRERRRARASGDDDD